MLAFAALQLGCSHRSEAVSPDASAPAVVASGGEVAPSAQPVDQHPSPTTGEGTPEENACVDRWLEERQLDRYGSPEGTMYAGGTPLFDERTGASTDRLVFVYGRHADARSACNPDAGPRPDAPATK